MVWCGERCGAHFAMGRMLEPVYIRMKKKTPVRNKRGSWGLS